MKSNSISLLNELTVYSQSHRRDCNLDISMLPILEEVETIYEDEQNPELSIFRTIIPSSF